MTLLVKDLGKYFKMATYVRQHCESALKFQFERTAITAGHERVFTMSGNLYVTQFWPRKTEHIW